jgi:uncharacterized RDD family membrane protein YckC
MNTSVKPRQFLFAGFISRFIAFMLDVFLSLAILVILRVTVEALLDFFGTFLQFLRPNRGDPVLQLGAFAGAGLLQIAYFVLFWTVVGQTPGMALMGLQVVRKDARPPTVLSSIVRYFGYWISLIPLGLGFLWILVDRQRRGWHDKLSGTYVVYASTARLYHLQLQAAKRHAEATAEQTLSNSVRQ